MIKKDERKDKLNDLILYLKNNENFESQYFEDLFIGFLCDYCGGTIEDVIWLNDEFLEFTIKTYTERERFTAKLLELTTDDELILHDVYGAISYQGDGVFIAGGAGFTPFVSILRDLKRQKTLGSNQLILANKTKSDIIYASEFEELLGPHFVNILSEENSSGFYHGVITSEFLKSVVFNFGHYFYLCGPPPMMEALVLQLKSLGVTDNQIIQEEFN